MLTQRRMDLPADPHLVMGLAERDVPLRFLIGPHGLSLVPCSHSRPNRCLASAGSCWACSVRLAESRGGPLRLAAITRARLSSNRGLLRLVRSSSSEAMWRLLAAKAKNRCSQAVRTAPDVSPPAVPAAAQTALTSSTRSSPRSHDQHRRQHVELRHAGAQPGTPPPTASPGQPAQGIQPR
jgi:hypothetical protein